MSEHTSNTRRATQQSPEFVIPTFFRALSSTLSPCIAVTIVAGVVFAPFILALAIAPRT